MSRLLQKFSVLLFCFGWVLPTMATDNSANRRVSKHKLQEAFINYLNGENPVDFSEYRLRLSEIEGMQQRVWNAWFEANRQYQEEKLLPLMLLSDSTQSRWVLPDSLEKNAVMPYYYGRKGSQKPDNGYPLFIYLHGSGDKHQEWATGLILAQRFADAPSAYFVPQIPNTGEYYRWWQKAKQFAWERVLRQALVSGEIDPDRIYMFGISEGGYGSQRLASYYADYLAGAGPMAGGEPLINAPVENLCNTAFCLRTGDKDFGFFRETLTRLTGERLDSLQAKHPGNFTHWVDLIPGRGHAIDYSPTTPWLKQFKRNTFPKKVMWENFEMDGNKRHGFYNLQMEAEPTLQNGGRAYITMEIQGNNIDIMAQEVRYTTVESRQGIPIRFNRSYTPLQGGKLRIYLNEELVDLKKEVRITINGKEQKVIKPQATLEDMVNSLTTFGDPRRIFPASVVVSLDNK